MPRAGSQYKLFETEARFENGFRYRPDFITEDEEELLLSFIAAQRLTHATGGDEGQYLAKRRHKHFGWGYDFRKDRLVPGPELPPFLGRFARRIEKMLDLSRGRVVEALINEYSPGAAIGWHKDNEPFEHVVGISLAGWASMRLRPLRGRGKRNAKDVIALEVEPRSVYVMQGPSRTDFQHSVAPTKTLRYSITFRTLPKDMKTPRRTYGKR